jgi:exonuclease III
VQQLGAKKATKINAVAYLMTVYNLDYLALTETGLAQADLHSAEQAFISKGMHFYGSAADDCQVRGDGAGQGVAIVLSHRFFLETVQHGRSAPVTVVPGRIMSLRLQCKAASAHTIFAVYGQATPLNPDKNVRAQNIVAKLKQSVKDALEAGSTVTVAGDLNIPLRDEDHGNRSAALYKPAKGVCDIASDLNDMGLTDLHHRTHPTAWQATVFAPENQDHPEKETSEAKLDYILGCQRTAAATIATTTDAYLAQHMQWDHALLLTETDRDAVLGTQAPKPHPVPHPRVSVSRKTDEAKLQWTQYGEACNSEEDGWSSVHCGELEPGSGVSVEGFTGL